MAEIPGFIRIGGTDYKISAVKELRDGRDDLNGHILYNDCEIKIDFDLTQHVQWVTIWHEVLHGILEHAGISEQDEQTVLALGYGIAQVIRDNEYLREYIGNG